MGTSDQSRTLSGNKARNYGEILFQHGKKLLDAELNLIQRNIFNNLRETIRSGLKYDSGFIKQSDFSDAAVSTFKIGAVSTDVNRVCVNGYVLDILGSGSSNDYENIITMPAKPDDGSRNDLVFIEVWESILKSGEDINTGYNKPTTTTIYKYGNTLYGGSNLDDDAVDPILGSITSDRIQIQYEIRVIEDATSLSGIACKDGTHTFSQATDPITGETLNGLYVAHGTNNQYARPEVDENDESLGYGFHWAIPVCVVPRTSVESEINVAGITDSRMKVGVIGIDPDADYTMHNLIITNELTVDDLTVGNLNLTDNTISSTSGNIILSPTDDIVINGGNLGIGTDIISQPLTVIGNASLSGDLTSDGLNVHSGVLYIDKTNDRVGIGTTLPNTDLHVLGNVRATEYFIGQESIRLKQQVNELVIRNSSDTASLGLKAGTLTSTGALYAGGGGVTITSGGYVGIGCTIPSDKLVVADVVHFDGIKVGNNEILINDIEGVLQIRNSSDLDFSNLKARNITVTGTFTSTTQNEVSIGDTEIQLNAAITSSSSNSDGGLRIKRLKDITFGVLSISKSVHEIVVDGLEGLSVGDFFELTDADNSENNGQYKIAEINILPV